MLFHRKPRKIVMVVSNSDAVAGLIEITMRDDARIEVRRVSSAAEAVGFPGLSGQKSRQTPDVLIVDWRLADLHGLEFVYMMRQNPSIHAIPILLLGMKSPLYNSEMFLESQAVQPDAILTQPFNPLELKRKIIQLLGDENRREDFCD